MIPFRRTRIACLTSVAAAVLLLAPAVDIRAASAADQDFIVPLMWRQSDSAWYPFDDELRPQGYMDIDQARRKAAWVHVERLSKPTPVVFADGSCLTLFAHGDGQRARKAPCTGSDPRQLWTVGASSLLTDSPVVPGLNALSNALSDSAGLQLRQQGTGYTWFAGAITRLLPLSATVGRVDAEAATAEITGHARPGATLLVDDDDTRRIPVRSDGTWSYTATDLAPGLNRLQFDEYVGEWKSATTQANVTIDVTPRPLAITSGHTFPGTPRTTITGTATPGATVGVKVFTVTETVTARRDGTWSYERGFNNALDYTIDVIQTAGDFTDRIERWAMGPAR